MRKKAFLYAYDKVNLGDDLFIRTIVNRYPHVHFFMWSDARNKMIFSDLKNLTVIDQKAGKFKKLAKIRPSLVTRYQENLKKKCDAVIYIGGSIFMEYPTWKNSVNWWNYQAEHHKFYVLGANFGPYQTEEYRLAMDEVFSKLQDVCFRDQYSYNLFQDNEKVRMAPDIIFSYPMPEVYDRQRQIFISVINCKQKEDGKFAKYQKQYEAIIEEVIRFFEKQNYYIKLVSFCKEEGDEEVSQNIKNRIGGERTSCLNYNGKNVSEILYELAASEYVIATRFHAIVLGLLAGKAVYPIIYSDKSKNMLFDLGFSGEFLDMRNMEKFSIDKMKKSFEEYGKVDLTNIAELSAEHFSALDQMFDVI